MKMSKTHLKTLILSLTLLNSPAIFAKPKMADKVDPKAEVLGRADKVKIQKEFCNKDGFDCSYVLYNGKGHREVLIEHWSRTANVYQFTPKLIGFLFGATGSGNLLTVINDQNQKKEYADFLAMNKAQTCMVTYERGLKNMPDSLVFYSVPDFRVRLVLNQKVPQFKNLSAPAGVNFEDNGVFAFDYSYDLKGELAISNVLVQNPCQPNYRIVMD